MLKLLRREEHSQLIINFRMHWIKRNNFSLLRQAVAKSQMMRVFQERRRRRLKQRVVMLLRERRLFKEHNRLMGA